MRLFAAEMTLIYNRRVNREVGKKLKEARDKIKGGRQLSPQAVALKT